MRPFYIGFVALLFIACQSTDYTLNITADVADSEEIYFIVLDDANQPKTLDTLTFTDGIASYTNRIEIPDMHYLMLASDRRNVIPFVVEPGEITIEVFKDSIQKSIVSGTKSNRDFKTYMEDAEPIVNDLFSIQNEMRNAMISRDSLSYVDLQEQFSEMQLKFDDYQIGYVANNPKSFIAALVLEQLVKNNKIEVEKARSLFDAFSATIKKTRSGLNIEKLIAPEEGDVQVGDVAPDFSGPSIDGSSKTLYTSMGKYTVVDFWASWCGPCRVDSPQLVDLYASNKEKGLNIIGVSVDKDRESWIKAIENDNLDWAHVSHLKRWDEPIAAQYGVTSIPQLFLLDAAGNVLARETTVEELRPIIEKILP